MRFILTALALAVLTVVGVSSSAGTAHVLHAGPTLTIKHL